MWWVYNVVTEAIVVKENDGVGGRYKRSLFERGCVMWFPRVSGA